MDYDTMIRRYHEKIMSLVFIILQSAGEKVSPGDLIDPWSRCGIRHLRLILHFTILPFIPSTSPTLDYFIPAQTLFTWIFLEGDIRASSP